MRLHIRRRKKIITITIPTTVVAAQLCQLQTPNFKSGQEYQQGQSWSPAQRSASAAMVPMQRKKWCSALSRRSSEDKPKQAEPLTTSRQLGTLVKKRQRFKR